MSEDRHRLQVSGFGFQALKVFKLKVERVAAESLKLKAESLKRTEVHWARGEGLHKFR